jgi:hypothetical protein
LEAVSSYRFYLVNIIISRRRRIPQFIYNGSSDEPSVAPLAKLDLSKRKVSKFMELLTPHFH